MFTRFAIIPLVLTLSFAACKKPANAADNNSTPKTTPASSIAPGVTATPVVATPAATPVPAKPVIDQNAQVGRAVQYIDAGLAQFAYGQTLIDGAASFVPRAIWPTKPIVVGGAALVTKYTGITFDPTTTVGVGNVMESYISFGTLGVMVWFIVLGAALVRVVSAQPNDPAILPLDDLKPGQQGEVWTVFQGTKSEPFTSREEKMNRQPDWPSAYLSSPVR